MTDLSPQTQFIITFQIGSRYVVNRRKMRQQVQHSFVAHGIFEAAVDISIVGERRMIELNEKLVGHQGVTDVLSFPQRDTLQQDDFISPPHSAPHFGDIVICYPVAVKEAARKGKLVDDIINFYIDHSIQHLLGIHHD